MILKPINKICVSITDTELGTFDIWDYGTQLSEEIGEKLLQKFGYLIYNAGYSTAIRDKESKKKKVKNSDIDVESNI